MFAQFCFAFLALYSLAAASDPACDELIKPLEDRSKAIYYNSTTYEHIGRFLETCADCMLWTDDAVAELNGETRKSRNLYIFSKTGKLDASDLEVFKKQAKCLNLLPDLYFVETTDLCPEEKEPTTDGNSEDQ
ncbi:hypothetical protein CRENBAI_007315 [Crenichthys baileyi]|uniref:Uncharacterized protein n=1 Tax=Crenichthys baileyi TaxID=28760 RepID=A0AAV9SET5_9TELE